ncbi:recombinase family protein [Paraburkholderia sp. Ac-20336]|nr:recombinase family protein [Paraburkholderia sp. Ac-20336]
MSTAGQTVENQRQAIAAAGYKVEKEFADAATSGTTAADSRSGWIACSQYLREGDALIVYSLDRLGRGVLDVISTLHSLDTRGIRLILLQQNFDTGTPAGKLALTMFAAFAEFENGIRKARQREGIARARMEGGKYQGRKPKLSAEQQVELRLRFNAGENRSQLARDFGIDRVTVHRYCTETSRRNVA